MSEISYTLDPPVQSISGEVVIGGEWVEIIPPEPLRSVVKNHMVAVRADGIDTFENDLRTIKFKDGRKVTVEAVLVDDLGQGYDLRISGTGGSGGGFSLGRERPPRDLSKPPSDDPVFPFERVYTKLRIRSDVPIQAAKIEWIGSSPK